MNAILGFTDKLADAPQEFNFGDRVRRKGQSTVFLVTGSEWVMRGSGETLERIYLAAFKQGSQAFAHELERA